MKYKSRIAVFLVAILSALIGVGNACTRVLYKYGSDNFTVGRTMDWYDDTGTDLWAFPRGMARDGGVGPNSIKWTSKYGSVVAEIYDIASADGMNEAGLVANILYLTESDYGNAKESGKPLLSVGAWTQYILDNFGTVSETVVALEKEPFAIVAPDLPGGKAAGGHIAIADASGDSAILEYIKGKLVIHHSRDYTVMTNSPPSVNSWLSRRIGRMLVASSSCRARIVRPTGSHESSGIWMLPQRQTILHFPTATVFSVIRNISVPLGIPTQRSRTSRPPCGEPWPTQRNGDTILSLHSHRTSFGSTLPS